ncbi:hypothetical protein GGS24DRAFT_484873 [Hypoxylon argillaceum]|nr:hypothetical protein GGS24DRAFT_484873 [Hypoxylon argillaceum]
MAPTNDVPPSSPKGLDGPAGTPPQGVVPNLDHPQNSNNLVRIVLIVILAISSIVVLLRVWSRIVLKRVDLPTFIAIVALALQLAFVSRFFSLLNTYGWFIHLWELRLRDFPAVNQIYFQGLILYISIALILKPAILLDWISIFCPDKTRNLFFWGSCVLITVHVLLYLSYFIVELAACHPFERNWNPLIPGHCLHTTGLAPGVAATNLTIDVFIFLLPQKAIWSLNMRLRAKLGISVIFAVGLIACVSAAFRLYYSLQYSGAADITYTFSGLALWSLAELTSGLIVLCGPSIPKGIDRMKLGNIGTSLKSWARTSVRRLAGSGNLDVDSFTGPAHKRSQTSMKQSIRSHEHHDMPVPPIPSGMASKGTNITLHPSSDSPTE